MKLVSSPTVMSPAAHPVRAADEQDDVDDVGHAVEQRLERAAQADRAEPGLAQPAGDHRQPLGLAALGAERLDHGDAVEALVHGLAELAQLVLRGVVEAVDAALVRRR